MLALRSVSAAGRRCKFTPLRGLATTGTPRTLPSSTALPRYQFSSIRSRGMAQVPVGQPTKPVPEDRSIVPLKNPDLSIDLKNIQGDIYPTFPKKAERFIFFSITNPAAFRKNLGIFRKQITTATAAIENLQKIEDARSKGTVVPLTQYQIGFSFTGMKTLNIGSPGDGELMDGQKQHAESLGDEPAPGSTSTNFIGKHWTKDWREKKIDGVILAASESDTNCKDAAAKAIAIFGNSIKVEITEVGQARPDKNKGHEHFGYLDGISQPAIKGLVQKHAGQLECDPGAIIMGLKGDGFQGRPGWAVGGSVMAFRKLHQRVPEFDKFLEDNPIRKPGLTPKEGSELRGARMVGRWKSGAPIDLAPDRDDPTLSDDLEKINNFDFQTPDPGQSRCPFTAHIRKTAPRLANKRAFSPGALIMRAGIPYGPEVAPTERQAKKTSLDRGLLFVSYQSRLEEGFSFIQKVWANNPAFPFPGATGGTSLNLPGTPGLDPIIGNATGQVRTRRVSGTDATATASTLDIQEDFVVAEGGEYFFVPPMKTIDRISNGDRLPGV
ncbi:hypothetical protein FRC01_001866 [Tulasnella sp. 417]|nr:hypothetical protein FRC01_001866 [Tulasnella sp. 417]